MRSSFRPSGELDTSAVGNVETNFALKANETISKAEITLTNSYEPTRSISGYPVMDKKLRLSSNDLELTAKHEAHYGQKANTKTILLNNNYVR